MRRVFLLQSALIILVGFLPFFLAKSYYCLHQNINYYKSLERADHLILGLSRAKRGISPSVLVSELELEGHMLNFAFNNMESPYGPKYLSAIKRKLRTTGNGVFILSVTPGSILQFRDVNSTVGFRENDFFYYKLWCQNCDPNVEFILRSSVRSGSLFQFVRTNLPIILGREETGWPERMHSDGWGELLEDRRKERTSPVFSTSTYRRSPEREKYLEKTIEMLKQHGRVYLVRLPVSAQYRRYEEVLMPDFDLVISRIAGRQSVPYFNYFTREFPYQYHDGHHIFGHDAVDMSRVIAFDIRSKVVY